MCGTIQLIPHTDCSIALSPSEWSTLCLRVPFKARTAHEAAFDTARRLDSQKLGAVLRFHSWSSRSTPHPSKPVSISRSFIITHFLTHCVAIGMFIQKNKKNKK